MTETYQWNKPRVMGRMYLLLRNGEDTGYLTFDGTFSTTARAGANGNEWTFTRAGLMKPEIHVRRAGDSADMAVGAVSVGGGCTIAIAGRVYHWRSISLLRGELAWVDDNGTPVIRYLRSTGSTRTIEVQGNVPPDAKEPLVLLGGYLLALQAVDVATMTAAVTAATAGV